jgi:signal transduction histidine kinase
LTVTDDGGEPAETVRSDAEARRLAMLYRAELIGARLCWERLATNGTRLTCTLPGNGTKHADQD